MALSEDEQRTLNLIAQSMYQDDPRLAATLATERIDSTDRKKAGIAVLIFLAGIVLLVSSAPLGIVPLGPVGFLIALAGAYYFHRNFSLIRRS